MVNAAFSRPYTLKTKHREINSSNCTSNENEAMNRFTENGVSMLTAEEHADSFLNENYDLEENWYDIVQVDLTDEDRLQQDAIWKFITTERNYIKELNVIVKHFISLFKGLKNEGNLNEIDEHDIFGNITDIFRTNESFWMDYILPILRQSRRDGLPIVASALFKSSCGQALRFNDVFRCYEKFCLGLGSDVYLSYIKILNTTQSESESSGQSDLKTNLRQWASWCEIMSQCGSTNLMKLLDKPRLRLTQYVMLLCVILHHTTEQSEIEFLTPFIEECTSFEKKVNDKVRQRLQHKQLVLCLEQLDEETATEKEMGNEVDSLSVKNFLKLPIKTLEPQEPRYILDESKMKLITTKKREKVKTFLFSDVLIVTKFNNSSKKYKIISEVYFLNKLNILKSQESKNIVVLMYLDDFGLLASTFSFELQPGEIDSWMAVVKRAKLCYEKSISGTGSIYDFFKHGDSFQQLFHYKKGKLLESFDEDGECANEIVFEDDFIQIAGTDNGCLPIASYTCSRNKSSNNESSDTNDIRRPVDNTTTISDAINDNKIGRKYNENSSHRPASIICFRQIDGDQITLIDYESNHPCFFLSFNKAAHKTTQTDKIEIEI